MLQVPDAIADNEEKRQGVQEVEVVFALHVTEEGAAAPDSNALLFAFLPVREYGFRCVDS